MALATSQSFADRVLADRLRAEFRWRRRLHSLDCVVDVRTGQVTLSNRISSARDRTVAMSVAINTPGVASVAFGKEARPRQISGATADAELTQRILDALEETAHVHTSSSDTKILVRSRRGDVTLRGTVGAGYERDAAIRVTQALFGVRRVRARIAITTSRSRDQRP